MRLAWLTDIHLNFLSPRELSLFLATVKESRPDALVITGDIGEADSVVGLLETIEATLHSPIYVVLGNHDFYRGTVAQVRKAMHALERSNQQIRYLTNGHIVPLSQTTCLVGDDGWPDGRNGDFEHSSVLLNDFLLIRDFRRPDQSIPRLDPEVRRFWLTVMQQLADESTARLEQVLRRAIPAYPNLLVATHVPPFREASQFNGQISRDDYQPFFSARGMGEMLLRIARDFPSNNLTVLCGHSHCAATYSPAPNLTVLTGGAEYGEPEVQKIWTL